MDKNYEANLNLDKLDEIGEGITDYVTDLNRDEINAFMEKIRDDLDKISENLDTQINESTKLADDIKDAWKAGVGGNKDEALTGIKRTVSRIPIVGRIVDHGHKSPSPRLKAALSVESEYLQNIKQTTNELKKIRTTLDSYLKGLEAKKKTLVAKETEIRLKLEKTKEILNPLEEIRSGLTDIGNSEDYKRFIKMYKNYDPDYPEGKPKEEFEVDIESKINSLMFECGKLNNVIEKINKRKKLLTTRYDETLNLYKFVTTIEEDGEHAYYTLRSSIEHGEQVVRATSGSSKLIEQTAQTIKLDTIIRGGANEMLKKISDYIPQIVAILEELDKAPYLDKETREKMQALTEKKKQKTKEPELNLEKIEY